ncbi:MFS transporter [Kineosporia babensis]|uniref:MFS transporter n=1 Tax=Kineosporia babensis TaxID=499548 RepID=A0A9X1T2N6_9ACTN|nr:MFS transporter [Kineosporia babensis]MCD5314833.1 MFS transporter [Kineosporia babensis]
MSSIPHNGAPGPSPGDLAAVSGRRWWILAVACLTQLMVVLDGSIVNIALPTAQQDLGFSDGNRQWVITGYALVFGALLLVGGRLGDLLGWRATFLTGLAGFAVASAIGGAANSFGILLAARIGQGGFGALLAPAALALVTSAFTDTRERHRAFALFSAVTGAGGAIGLVLGGALAEFLSWRWCLYVNLPLVLIAAVGGLWLLERQQAGEQPPLDLRGALLSVTGLVALVYGLSNAETAGWSDGSTLTWIFVGLGLLAAFVWVQARVEAPLLPLGIVLDRNRGGSLIALSVAAAGLSSLFLFLVYYLSTILGYRPLTTGVAFLPLVGAIVVAAQAGPFLIGQVGPRVPVTAGFLIASVSLFSFTRLGLASTYTGDVLPGLLLVGAGIGLVMAPAITAATDRVEHAHAGVASATVTTVQQVGYSIGTAVFSAVAAGAADEYLSTRTGHDPRVVAQSLVESYTAAFGCAGWMFVLGALVCFLVLRSGPLTRDPDSPITVAH